MKKVVQISLDIRVDEDMNGCDFAEEIAKFLDENDYEILGTSFQDDLTDVYKNEYGYSME